MKKLVIGTLAAAVLLAPRIVGAQSKTLTGETKVATATIEALEAQTRTITLKKADGTYVTTVAGPDVTRFAELKVGDKVTARYYDNLVIRMKKPGDPDISTGSTASTGSGQALPGGTTAKQVAITATITAIDPKAPSITFTGPNGWKYTSRVEDTKALEKVKVGDKVDIIWTEALLVSVDRAK